jgi:hypothetical protein
MPSEGVFLARSCGLDQFSMNQVIADSIRQKRRLRFIYNGKMRLAEPQCYGIGTKGTELLRVHQIEGGSQREPLFDVSKIRDLIALEEVFTRPGPNYKKNDSAMTTIFCQL